jgi:hypothetical protein
MEATPHQLFLGDDRYAEWIRRETDSEVLREHSKAQKRSMALPLTCYEDRYQSRNEAMANAFKTGAYTMREIADHFREHYMTVSRAVRRHESDYHR